MLTLRGGQVESLWDEVLPIEVRELPDDLARLDRVLADPVLFAPIAAAWQRSSRDRGRPSISMAVFVRLMVVKARTGWGYERSCGRSRTRRICGGSVWSRSTNACRTSRRSESSPGDWEPRSWRRSPGA